MDGQEHAGCHETALLGFSKSRYVINDFDGIMKERLGNA